VHDSEYESDDCTTGIEYEPIDDDDDDSDATVPVSTDGEDDYEQNVSPAAACDASILTILRPGA